MAKKLLEIGCGTGNLAPFFLKEGYNYTGLDSFNEMLMIAREVLGCDILYKRKMTIVA